MASELRVNRIVNSSGISTISLDSSGINFVGPSNFSGTVSNLNVTSVNNGPVSGTRNRIINGAMEIDQRNNGGQITVNQNGFNNRLFPIDRFPLQKNSSGGTISGIRSTDVPSGQGFNNSFAAQVASAGPASPASTDYLYINHRVEGYNVADFNFGTAFARTFTLSFWVKSSIAGIYCVGFSNYADNRSIPVEYRINSPNVWEYKTITLTADTVGTWEKTNSGGLNIAWVLSAGTSYQGTNNVWTSGVILATSNQTNTWFSTASNTFYLTGVQLELGSVATSFERRSYGQELALCERYYEKSYNQDVAVGSVSEFGAWESVSINVVDFYDYGRLNFRTRKRTIPTLTLWSTNGILGQWRNLSSGVNQGNSGSNNVSETGAHLFCVNNAMTASNAFRTQWSSSAEL